MEEGIVPGGGVALLRAVQETKDFAYDQDEVLGASILMKATEAPLRCMLENAGLDASVVINEIKLGESGYGFNAKTEVFEDLIKAGVIDPAKVVRVALENAASVAGMILTTECVLNEIEE